MVQSRPFTSALVAHSHLAMAGFTSAFVVLLLGILCPAARHACARWRWVWNLAVLGHVLALAAAGWLEGNEHGWLAEGAGWRTACLSIRWLAGLVMLGASIAWLGRWRAQLKTNI